MRLFVNLGLMDGRMRFEYAQNLLQDAMPEDIRKTLHVNAVAHGRETCVPRMERCDRCVIADICCNRRQIGARRAREWPRHAFTKLECFSTVPSVASCCATAPNTTCPFLPSAHIAVEASWLSGVLVTRWSTTQSGLAAARVQSCG